MDKEGYVILLKTFFSKCTPQAIEYLDIHVNDWVVKENAKILSANQSFGVVEGKGGANLKEALSRPISTLDLSVRASNCMREEKIETVGDGITIDNFFQAEDGIRD